MPHRSIPPLPAKPAPPVVTEQSAFAQKVASLADTARWRYRLRYLHEHAAQDEVIVAVAFNLASMSDATDDAPPRIEYRVVARLEYSDDGECIASLRLTRVAEASGPAGNWPDVDWRSPSGEIVDLGNGTGEGAERTYGFDPPVPAGAWPDIGLTWHGLDVAHAQNARASLAAVRNRELEPVAGGDEVVVYRTATIDAMTAVAPLNRWSQDIDIGDFGDTVHAALDAILSTLFGRRRVGQRIALELHYAYRLLPDAEPDASLMVMVPVGLSPQLTLDATTVAQIAATLAAWHDATSPPATGAEWVFSLVQFSQVDTREPAPLLDLRRLVYRLK